MLSAGKFSIGKRTTNGENKTDDKFRNGATAVDAD